MLSIKKIILFVLFFTPVFFFNTSYVFAADFTTNYKVDYYLDENDGDPLTKVKMQIDILNNTSNSYINKFSISFPKIFKVDNPTALYKEPLTPVVTSDDLQTTIEVTLPEPKLADKNKTTIYYDFYQENLFKINGNIWEVILPTVDLQKGNEYEIALHLPETSTKKLSISKPIPTSNDGTVIRWKNPATRTIYTTFGAKQLYDLNLKYHLENTEFKRVYTDIAFPPDSLYQRIYVGAVSPQPDEIFSDEDGNYIGRYILNPKESKSIEFNGVAEIYSSPRPEVQTYEKRKFQSQKKYLLDKNEFWSVAPTAQISTIDSIFTFVTETLTYDLAGVNSNKKRLGAAEALRQPTKAVCTEFTDLFVALARQSGVYAREIEGYGFSHDSELRPLSENSDILHAWPEYYDERISRWVPVDPTWQSTSGIDYFSSFDLNHIVFAVHGKDPQYPLPAGTYKIKNTKDVVVSPVSDLPKEKVSVSVTSISLPTTLVGDTTYTVDLEIKNDSNVYMWSMPLTFITDLQMPKKEVVIDAIAPMETKKIAIVVKVPTTYKLQSYPFEIKAFNTTILDKTYPVMPFYYNMALKVAMVLTSIVALLLIGKFLLSKLRLSR